EEAGYFKPHWKTYAKAAEIIGEDPTRILFVANHAFDCIGAKSDGMRTAFVNRRKRQFGHTPHHPDLVVADFSELGAVLAWVAYAIPRLILHISLVMVRPWMIASPCVKATRTT